MKFKIILLVLLSVTFISAQNTTYLANPDSLTGHWTFDNPDSLTAAAVGNPLQLTGTHTAIQGYGDTDGAVNIGVGSYYTAEHGIKPNGGGSMVNDYSIVMDVRFPQLGQWYALYQTDTTNVSDGDWFISSSGKLGIKAVGYTSKKLEPNKWYRLAMSVSNGTKFDYFVNGKKVLTGTPQEVDGRFALSPKVLFFADENGEDNSLDVTDIKVFSKALTDEEIGQLGGYPNIELLSPIGGEEWPVNTQQTILWESTAINNVKIEYSADSMATWATIADNVPAADQAYEWTVPDTVIPSAFIKITSLEDTSVYDISKHSFAIVEGNQGPGLVGQWTFDNPDSLTSAIVGSPLQLVGTHAFVEGASESDGAVNIGPGSYYVVEHGIAPNGGGSLVNKYTLVMDVKIPLDGLWYSLYQTDTTNVSDGDWFISSSGKLGIRAAGYSDPIIFANKWYRIAMAISSGHRQDYYVNGVKVHTGEPQEIDGRFALTPKVLLFADESGEDNSIYVSEVKLYDHDLSDSEIADLGGFPEIEVTAPNGGEFWTTGSFPRITWKSKNVGVVRIEFSADNGNTWDTIATATPAVNGEYTSWKIPDDLNSDSCLIKITKQDNPNFYDVSDNVFKIKTSDQTENIVVLGSSTAAGFGPSSPDSAWVNRYRKYIFSKNTTVKVINLAVGGYTTYELMPTGFVPPAGRPQPDTLHNITKALSYNPWAIIINLPSNDVTNGFSIEEQLANYDTMLSRANAANVPVWVSTTQPRNLSDEKRQLQMEMRDSTFSHFGDYAIDFWTGLADSTGRIKPEYNSGDGVHLNNAGHRILFERVVAKQIYEQTIFPTSIKLESMEIPKNFRLLQNYPNPFNPSTKISFALPKTSNVKLKIYDMLGREVKTLVNEKLKAGNYSVNWNASGMASGIYFYVISTNNFVQTKKMILLK